MKKSLHIFIFFFMLSRCLWGQESPGSFKGVNYQAAAFEASGQAIANQMIDIKVSFSTQEKVNSAQVWYLESHLVRTDARGVFNLIIGEGSPINGNLKDIPWTNGKVWLNVEVIAPGNRRLSHSSEIHAVPYAFHAATASRVEEESPFEKDQSIRWTTTGNNDTQPGVHYLGTEDARDLVFKTNLKTNATITHRGQLQITGRKSGPDTDPNNYPFLIEGGDQGIFIKVNGSRDNSNNFVAFSDESGLWGVIRGQTFDELVMTKGYKLKISNFAARGAILTARSVLAYKQGAFLYAAGTGANASLLFIYAAPGFYGAATAAVADGIAISLQAGKLLEQSITWGIKTREDIGVEYASGSGDYAEALERLSTERDLHWGEIVGIKGGKVSLNTKNADQILVVSKAPIVLGNLPQPHEEQNYEKIAFLGQVDVRVVGKVKIGDYILASGNHDGLGIAAAPSTLGPGDYRRIVGVAWEEAEDQTAINLVKIGVGLNKNDLAPQLEALHQKADSVIAFLQGKSSLPTQEMVISGKSDSTFTIQVNDYNPRAWEQQIEANEEYLRKFYAEFTKQLQEEGVPIPDDPTLQQLFKDPVNTLKKLRLDPKLRDMWLELDAQMPQSSLRKH